MRRGHMLVLTGPVSTDREDEFNHWFEGTHARDVLRLRGVTKMKRYRAITQLRPAAESPTCKYLAMYELEDIDLALSSFVAARGQFSMSDSMDVDHTMVLVFEPVSEQAAGIGNGRSD
jgi:hypothetical protein